MEHEEETLYLSTGELAKLLKVSVRTIRYYDQIGLVQPSSKTSGGKRQYSKKDIFNLQKILLLKSLNLSLEDSRRVLAEQSISSILIVHKSLLMNEIKGLNHALEHTQTLLNLLDLEGTVDWEDLISLVQTTQIEGHWDRYFSQEQQSLLKNKMPKLEIDNLNMKKWINMIKRIELCLEKKLSPKSREGLLILEDVNILSHETFGSLELTEAFWKVRKSAKASAELGLYPIDPAVIDFLEQV